MPRYLCLHCGHTFSKRAFACTYYLKRPELLVPVAAGLQAGSAHRQIARSQGCAPSTVTRLAARLGRHAMLLQTLALSWLERLDEPLVVDHFETFEGSQDEPFGVATAVGSRSWFVYALDPAPHRRTGRRSSFQQARLKRRPTRALRGGYQGSFRRIVEVLCGIPERNGRIALVTDGHEDYRRVLAHRREIRHLAYPNPQRGPKGSPRSAQARARDAAMFPNDLLHRILRHSLAHHRRETIAFGRRLNALMERLFLAGVWRNFVKWVSERKAEPITPAMHLGLTDRPWTWERVLARRLFPTRLKLPRVWNELYRRQWTTPTLPSNTIHDLRRAF